MGKQRRANMARAEAGIIFRDGKLVSKDDWLKARPYEAHYKNLLQQVGGKPPWWFALRTIHQRIAILEAILANKRKAAPAGVSGHPPQGA